MTAAIAREITIVTNEPMCQSTGQHEGRCWTWLKSLTPFEKLILGIFLGSVIATIISTPFMNKLSPREQTLLVVVLACGLVAPPLYAMCGIQPPENLRQLNQYPPVNV